MPWQTDCVTSVGSGLRFFGPKWSRRAQSSISWSSHGTFQRSLRLTFRVAPAQAQASFENGVLTVAVPMFGRGKLSAAPAIGEGGAAATRIHTILTNASVPPPTSREERARLMNASLPQSITHAQFPGPCDLSKGLKRDHYGGVCGVPRPGDGKSARWPSPLGRAAS
jgi:hypothetical protein